MTATDARFDTVTTPDTAANGRGSAGAPRGMSTIRPFLISSMVLLACAGVIGIAATSASPTTAGPGHSAIVAPR